MLLGAISGLNPLSLLAGTAATKAIDAVSSLFAPDQQVPVDSGELQPIVLDKDQQQQFLDFAKLEDTEKARLAWFQQNDLTAEHMAGMDAQQRAGLEEILRKKTEEHVWALTGKTAGGLANLVV
jgi:hypothetical protein